METSQQKTLVDKFIQSLTPKEKKAMEIAKSHLGMSFQIEKSVAFISWCKTCEK
jgi:hypothetical protein